LFDNLVLAYFWAPCSLTTNTACRVELHVVEFGVSCALTP